MLSGQDVDRELKAALAVSPSPGFEARVLHRVEAERPARGAAHYRWLAAAAALVIAAGVFYAMTRTASPLVPQIVRPAAPPAPQVVERTPPRPVMPPPGRPVHSESREPTRLKTVLVSQHAPRRAEPEVLVPPNQMEAVRRLVRAINEGRVEVPAEPPQGPMAPAAAVTVRPVVVEPIPLVPLGPAGETTAPLIRRFQ